MKLAKKNTIPPSVQPPERELPYQIAQNVFDLRTEQGLSQADLAARAGTKQPRISVLERASGSLPTLPLLLRVAEALGARLVVRLEKKTGEPNK